MNLIDLISRCQKNDRKAQTFLYHTYKDVLFGTALKYCKNTVDAEDILHESFLNILKNISKYSGKGSFEGWLKRIVINKSIDRYNNKEIKYLELVEDRIEEAIRVDELRNCSLEYLLKLVQELPDRYRLVFNMYELDGFTHNEIATTLSISVGTSKSNLHRARKALKMNIIKAEKSKSKYG